MTRESLGVISTFDLCPEARPGAQPTTSGLLRFLCVSMSPIATAQGAATAVSAANRAEYVALYTRWCLNDSIERQYQSFEVGFRRLCRGPCMSLFRGEELELLLCGNPVLDFAALEAGSTYDDGYSRTSQPVRSFSPLLFLRSSH